nr:MAG TPA: hypothetical protein [Caudoviricetes sp.]
MENYSLSDLAAVTKDADGMAGNGAWWIIILFLFVIMGGGWNGFNRQSEFGQYATAASQQEILFGQQFGQINDRLTNIGNGICNLGYEMQGDFGQLTQTVMSTGNSIQSQLAQCCCENRLATANLSAQIDRQTCDITTAIHAEGEQTRAMMQANEIQQLRDKVNSLEADNRMYGVVRYPNGYTYTAGPSPFCGCNSGCGCA